MNEADSAISRCKTEEESRKLCEQSHAEVGALLLAWRDNEKATVEQLRQWSKSALDGLEVAVPLPPLPLRQPVSSARPEENEAASDQDTDNVDFDWLFFPLGQDVVSVMKAGALDDRMVPALRVLRDVLCLLSQFYPCFIPWKPGQTSRGLAGVLSLLLHG